MSSATADPGSFRDPGGRIFLDQGRVLRAVYDGSRTAYEAARDSGLYAQFIENGWLVPSCEVATGSSNAGLGAAYLLEHPVLPFISYPYEWTFSQLKCAALFQLQTLLASLERGFTLSDATAYNVQFEGSQPRFVDHLSFRPYVDGEIWTAHRQFCMQFLNPLILWSRLKVAPNHWYRGSLEGISPEDLASLLKGRDRLSITIASHVIAQASIQRRANAGRISAAKQAARPLTRTAFKAILIQLRDFISGLGAPGGQTVWQTYSADNSYVSETANAKHRFVGDMIKRVQPQLLIDLGCNSGDFSATALDHGAQYVVGFDFDFGALEYAFDRSAKAKLPFLPLWLDATNPSPSQGWNQAERGGFAQRAKGDAVIALAFIHHLAIARNIPLDAAVDWIMTVGKAGVIEFPPKADPMVQQLLQRRQDIFPDYCEESFLSAVGKRGRIVSSERLTDGGRLMVAYDRT